MIVLLILLLLSSCMKTEVINAYVQPIADTTRTKGVDTTMVVVDTTRIPIGFHPEVEDWEQKDIDINRSITR